MSYKKFSCIMAKAPLIYHFDDILDKSHTHTKKTWQSYLQESAGQAQIVIFHFS